MDSNLIICVVTVVILLSMAILVTILVRRYRYQNSSRERYSDNESCRPAHRRHWLSVFSKKPTKDTIYRHTFYALSEPQSLPPAYLSWSSSTTASPTQHMLEGYDTRCTILEESSMDPIQFSLAKQDEADRIWYHRDSTSTFHHQNTKRLSEAVSPTSLEYHVW
jgi:hypothetical protein